MSFYQLKFISFLLLLFPFVVAGQACGAGLYSLKIFTNDGALNCELFYVSEDKVDGIAHYRKHSENWLEEQQIGNGVLIDSAFAHDIIQKSFKKYPYKAEIKNNILKVITPELQSGLVLIKLNDQKRNAYLITNAGGCAKNTVALIWNENPKISRIDYNFNLENLGFSTGNEKSIGKIDDVDFVYECYGCTTTVSDSITIFARKGQWRKKLATVPIYDFYLDDIELLSLQGHDFIYVSSTHTYGHAKATLFSLSRNMLLAEKVKLRKSDYVIPDSLYVLKGFGLVKDKNNNFTSGYFLRSENTGDGHSIIHSYELKKIDWNLFELVPTRTDLTKAD